MSRGNQILTAVLVVQVVLAAVLLWPRTPALAGSEPLLGEIEAKQIVALTITDPIEGQIRLSKSTGVWVLPNVGDYLAKQETVTGLLNKLVALKADRVVTETRASHKRLKVADDEYVRLIVVKMADGTQHTIYMGTSPSYSVTHVRLDGQDRVYLVSDLTATDANVLATSWIDTLYLSLTQDQVVAMTIDNVNGRLAFQKDEAGMWTMDGLAEGDVLNESAVTSLLARISSLRLLRPLGQTAQDDFGLDAPQAVLTVQTRDEAGTVREVELRIGVQSAEDNAYVIKSSENPYYVQASEYSVQDLVANAYSDFIQLPPTPAPAAP